MTLQRVELLMSSYVARTCTHANRRDSVICHDPYYSSRFKSGKPGIGKRLSRNFILRRGYTINRPISQTIDYLLDSSMFFGDEVSHSFLTDLRIRVYRLACKKHILNFICYFKVKLYLSKNFFSYRFIFCKKFTQSNSKDYMPK